MATLATQLVTRLGLARAYGASAAGGDRFVPDAYTTLNVKNGSAGALTVTVAATKIPLPNQTISNVSVSVPAGQEYEIGPFPYDTFAATDGSGLADITYPGGVGSLTIAVVRSQQP